MENKTYISAEEPNPQRLIMKGSLNSQKSLLELICDANQLHLAIYACSHCIIPGQILQNYFVLNILIAECFIKDLLCLIISSSYA